MVLILFVAMAYIILFNYIPARRISVMSFFLFFCIFFFLVNFVCVMLWKLVDVHSQYVLHSMLVHL